MRFIETTCASSRILAENENRYTIGYKTHDQIRLITVWRVRPAQFHAPALGRRGAHVPRGQHRGPHARLRPPHPSGPVPHALPAAAHDLVVRRLDLQRVRRLQHTQARGRDSTRSPGAHRASLRRRLGLCGKIARPHRRGQAGRAERHGVRIHCRALVMSV